MRRRPFTRSRRSTVLSALSLTAVLAWAASGPAETLSLRLEPQGLEALGRGFVYEGWLIADGAPVSAGTFTIGADGSPERVDLVATVADGAVVGPFVLTVEPSPDPDPASSAVHLMAGDFAGGVASLTVGHSAALGSDFAEAAGDFILAAPSAGAGGDGALLGTLDLTLAAYEQRQLNGVFALVTSDAVEVGYAVVRTPTAAAASSPLPRWSTTRPATPSGSRPEQGPPPARLGGSL